MSDSQLPSKSKRKKTRNKHWKFVKSTFRQSNFAKALLPRGSGHAPLTDDKEEEKTQEQAAAPSPLQQSFSEASTLRRGKQPPSSHSLKEVSSSMATESADQFNVTAPPEFTRNKRTGSLKRLNSYHIHKDGYHHHDSFNSATAADESSNNSESTQPFATPIHASLEDARQCLLAQAHRRRRLGFLQQSKAEEDSICKTLGMDCVYGKCIRHSNQPITANVQALMIGNEFHLVQICRICQSEMRAGPLQSSSAALPHMGSVIEQVQKLQSNTKEWDRRTQILGASVMDLNKSTTHSSSHHTHSVATETIREDHEVEEFGGDESLSLMDLQKQSSHGNITGHSRSQRSGRNNRSSSSSLQYTEDEWAKQLSRRIMQVRTWEDRFAIKNHPTFCQYFKMLRMGVPLLAVQHAVEMDGYHPSIMKLEANKSLKMQQHKLSPEAMENLRTTGALGETVGGKGAEWEQELSIPETVDKVLKAFRQKRVNQIYATMALFSETKLKMKLQQQQRTEVPVDEQSITSKSIQSLPNPVVDNPIDDPEAIRRRSAREVQSLEMDDEISQSERIRDDVNSLAKLREDPETLAEERQQIPTSSQKSHKSKETAPTESPHTSLSSRRDHLASPNASIRARPAEVEQTTQPTLVAPKRLESPSRLTQWTTSPASNIASPSRSRKSWTIRGVGNDDNLGSYPQSPSIEIADVLAVADHAIEQDRSKRSALMASSPRASPGNSSPKSRSQTAYHSPKTSSRRSGRRTDSTPTSPRRKLSKESPSYSRKFGGPIPSKSQSQRKLPISPPIKEVVVSSSDEDAEFVDHVQIEDELHSLIRRESNRNLSQDDGKINNSGAVVSSVQPGTSIPDLPRAFSRTSSTSNQGIFIPEEDYFNLKKELDLALEAIALKEDQLRDSVRKEEYKRLLFKLEAAEHEIYAKQQVIDDSVRMVEFMNLSEELESARAMISVKSTTLQESVSKQEYTKVKSELRMLKDRLAAQKRALEQSISVEEYESLSKEVDERDNIIGELEQEVQKLKKELGSVQIMFVEKEEAAHHYKKEAQRKDQTIVRLNQRIQELEERQSSPILENSTMRAKIEDAKRRQAALREKFISPHRMKKTASGPQTDRDFEALALSPPGRKPKPDVKRRRKPKDGSSRRSTRGTAPPEYSRSESALQRSTAAAQSTPTEVMASASQRGTPRRISSTSDQAKESIVAPPLINSEESIGASKQSLPTEVLKPADPRPVISDEILTTSPNIADDAATKEVIMNLFDSWTSKQFAS